MCMAFTITINIKIAFGLLSSAMSFILVIKFKWQHSGDALHYRLDNNIFITFGSKLYRQIETSVVLWWDSDSVLVLM